MKVCIVHRVTAQLKLARMALKRAEMLRDCAIIIRRGAEKLELSSKNLDSTPPPKQKKLVLTPLCYVKNNVAPPSPTTIAVVQDTSPETNSNAVGDGILRPYSSRP